MVELKGKFFKIYDFERPTNQNYMIYQILGIGKNFSVVLTPDNYSLEVGREFSEMEIPDPTISSTHGFLQYDN